MDPFTSLLCTQKECLFFSSLNVSRFCSWETVLCHQELEQTCNLSGSLETVLWLWFGLVLRLGLICLRTPPRTRNHPKFSRVPLSFRVVALGRNRSWWKEREWKKRSTEMNWSFFHFRSTYYLTVSSSFIASLIAAVYVDLVHTRVHSGFFFFFRLFFVLSYF